MAADQKISLNDVITNYSQVIFIFKSKFEVEQRKIKVIINELKKFQGKWQEFSD